MVWQFDDGEKKTKKQKTDFERECAIKLFNALHVKRKADKFNLTSWRNAFRNIIKVDKIPKETIVTVLGWYLNNIGKEYVPECSNAIKFRSKFKQLERMVEKNTTISSDGLSPVEAKIYRQFKDKEWPSNVHRKLPQLIQKSISAYKTYWLKVKSLREELMVGLCKTTITNGNLPQVKKWKKQMMVDTQDLALIGYCMGNGHLTTPGGFIGAWIGNLQEMYSRFDQWNGDTDAMVFDPDSERFNRWGTLWAHNWCKDGSRWERLNQRIKDQTLKEE